MTLQTKINSKSAHIGVIGLGYVGLPLVVLESTTYPGTTDQDVRAILEKGGLKAGTDFHLAFSPEREDPNNKDFGLSSIPKVVGGYTQECLAAAMAMYGAIVEKTVPVSSPRVW